jgi:hypothetical protein
MRKRAILTLFSVALGVTSCAYYGDYRDSYARGSRYGDYAYAGHHWGREGAQILDPWLAATPEGRTIVSLGFGGSREGGVSGEGAQRANVWFRRYADYNGDMRLTDEEIRTALVHAARQSGYASR